jgi:hypothetical protein
MAVVSNGTTLIDAGALGASAGAGKLTLIKTLTASSSSTLSFVDGASSVVLDSTYDIYLFKYINMHPASDEVDFSVNFRDGGTNYDATKTTSAFAANLDESHGNASLFYWGSRDLAQSTGVQKIASAIGNGSDECASGELYLFNPSSTTFVKHFIGKSNGYHASNYTVNQYVGGYCNVTAAIDAVQFSMSSGNIDAGTIKLYGVG